MWITKRVGWALRAVGTTLLFLDVAVLYAVPDAYLRPRYIENYIRNRVARDTARLENRGDEDLIWSLEVRAEGWLSASPTEGRVEPGQRDLIIIISDGRNLVEDHNYGDLVFSTNDPAARQITLPVAGRLVAYPIIAAGWPEGWGDWWGFDMNNVYESMEWEGTYTFNITIRNDGLAELQVEDISADNGMFTITPAQFNLAARTNRQIQLIFHPEEVGPVSTTITSRSNAWDPRELNFRVVGDVNPVFRLRSHLDDLSLDEDAPDTLVADLDTVFFSSDNSRRLEVAAPGLVCRIERNGNLYIRPTPNWFGRVEAVARATLADSVLTDTFVVSVRPLPDPPGAFDLLYPVDGDTVHFSGDALNLFVWSSSRDPDRDTVTYILQIQPSGNDSVLVWQVGTDTQYTREVLGEVLNPDTGGRFAWWVTASDGTAERRSNSVFTAYVPPAGVVGENRSAALRPLFVLHPNPFNAQVAVRVVLERPSRLRVEVLDLWGRVVDILYDGDAAAGPHALDWNAGSVGNGLYLVRASVDGCSVVRKALLVR